MNETTATTPNELETWKSAGHRTATPGLAADHEP
jgi:hypothetical protein